MKITARDSFVKGLHSLRSAKLGSVLRAAVAGARNVPTLLPGDRPDVVIVDLAGALAPRTERPKLFGLPLPTLPMTEANLALDELVETLEALGRASWLSGVLFRFEGFSADPASAYALRRAIERLGLAGKATTAYLTHLDGTSYYVASAAREIVAPESAELALRGFGVSITFLGEGLERLGVRFEKVAIAEYKNAFDNFARSEMSAPHREQLEAVLDGFEAHHAEAIGASRRIAPAEVRAILAEGVSSAARAKEAKLLDRVAYEDAIIGKKHAPLSEARRFVVSKVPTIAAGRVGVVWIAGGIVGGRSRRLPAPFGNMTGSDAAIGALRAAARDESTRAVVLAIDSPGGSALASDLIDHEVELLRARKPVVAVMGAVAASGGYYVAAHANRIVAAPTTVTGSIGVLTGKVSAEALFARFGLHTARLQRGRFALLLDASRSFDEEERQLLERSNTEVYERFVARVADGRRLDPQRVRELAKGRIWTGSDALDRGLVDELGDLGTGLARARELGGLRSDAPVWNIEAPREELPLTTDSPADALLWLAATLSAERSWLVASGASGASGVFGWLRWG